VADGIVTAKLLSLPLMLVQPETQVSVPFTWPQGAVANWLAAQ
jgi:hypothetical protein